VTSPIVDGAGTAKASQQSGLRSFFEFLLTRPTDNAIVQLFRYGFVGGIAFLFDFFGLLLLIRLGVHYLVAAAISFTVGLAVNYIISILWVFPSSSRRATEAILFAVIGVVGLGLNEVIIWFGHDVLGLAVAWAKIVSTVLVFFWNFILRRLMFIFMKRLDLPAE
jgi:putative flippase GtrA